jgi:hypothetical protein
MTWIASCRRKASNSAKARACQRCPKPSALRGEPRRQSWPGMSIAVDIRQACGPGPETIPVRSPLERKRFTSSAICRFSWVTSSTGLLPTRASTSRSCVAPRALSKVAVRSADRALALALRLPPNGLHEVEEARPASSRHFTARNCSVASPRLALRARSAGVATERTLHDGEAESNNVLPSSYARPQHGLDVNNA